MTDKLTTASVLAFERKLDPSDAVFHAGRWDDRAQSHAWQPVKLFGSKSCAAPSAIGSRPKNKTQPSWTPQIEKPNLQTVDVATLPAEADTLKVQFTLRVLGGAGTPSACNSAAYQAKLLATVQGYVQQHGFGELARRYAANLANGRFLWRNRAGAEQVEVTVEQMQSGQAAQIWSFDALALNTRAVGCYQ
jgi:CRISPR-associated protein Csy3